MTYRDVVLAVQNRFNQKQDLQNYKRVVITDQQGNQSGAGTIWANRKLRRVWYMAHGAAQPAQAYCSGAKIPNPQIGMRAYLGFSENSNEPELFEDPTLRNTNTNGQPVTITPEDLQPGGRYFLWLQSKAIQPLATFPTGDTGLSITVVGGYYPYGGNRKYFGGVYGLSLSASVPGAGLKRRVGLYLDSSNVLQTVNGSTVATTGIAPEPTWPAGAFRLSTVTLENGQTSIDFAGDIEDYRMPWSDENGGGGGWPFDNILTVSSTNPNADYTTIGAAITAASAGDVILLDAETYTEFVDITKSLTIIGLGVNQTIITLGTSDSTTVYINNSANVALANLTITNTGAGTTSQCLRISGVSSTNARLENLVLNKSGGATNSYAIHVERGSGQFVNCQATASGGTTSYAYLADTSITNFRIFNGLYSGGTADIRCNGSSAIINLINPVLSTSGLSVASGTCRGTYHTSIGNWQVANTTGVSSGVWLIDESATLKIKYADLAAAVTAAASSGDSIILETDTYTIAARQDISKSLTIQGNGPEATILDFSVANDTCFDFTADNITVTFRNLTIDHSAGGSTAAGPLFTNNSGVKVILDNAIVKKSGGAPTMGYGAWWLAGTLELRNGSKLLCTSGTSKYGIINDSSADVTIIIGPGCEVGGGTADLYSNRTGSTVTNYGKLTNGLVDWAGTVNWLPENKIIKNLLYSSLTHNVWQEGTTFNDIADDTYGPDTVWNVLQNGQAPDVSGQAGGSTDPFTEYFRCTFDSASSQAGIVQFLEAEDTYPLRGQVVSLSADLWGSNVSTLRMAVLIWTSTANAITSDVVGTWSTGNPTLATNWAYIGTPAAIAISATRTRYTVNNLLVPTNANNIGVFIWTDAEEASGDYFNVARVQLERGPVATEFVARPYTQELLAINRFALTIGRVTGSRFLGGRVDGTNVAFFGFKLPVEMVQVPAITLNNGAGNVRINDGSVNVNVSAISTNFSTKDGIGVNLTAASSTLTLYRPIFIDFTATDTYLLFNARL